MNGIATFDILNGRPKEKGMTLLVQVLFTLLYSRKKNNHLFSRPIKEVWFRT